jgi:hypothetical protein
VNFTIGKKGKLYRERYGETEINRNEKQKGKKSIV